MISSWDSSLVFGVSGTPDSGMQYWHRKLHLEANQCKTRPEQSTWRPRAANLRFYISTYHRPLDRNWNSLLSQSILIYFYSPFWNRNSQVVMMTTMGVGEKMWEWKDWLLLSVEMFLAPGCRSRRCGACINLLTSLQSTGGRYPSREAGDKSSNVLWCHDYVYGFLILSNVKLISSSKLYKSSLLSQRLSGVERKPPIQSLVNLQISWNFERGTREPPGGHSPN